MDASGAQPRAGNCAARCVGYGIECQRNSLDSSYQVLASCLVAGRCYGTAAAAESSAALESSVDAPLPALPPSSGRFHSAAFQPLLNAAIRSLEKPWSWTPLNSSPPRL